MESWMQVSLKQLYLNLFPSFSSLLLYFNSICELINGDCLPTINNNADSRFYAQKAMSSRIQKISEAFKSFILYGYIIAASRIQSFLAIDKTYSNNLVNITTKIFVRNDAAQDYNTLVGRLKAFVRADNNFSCAAKCQNASIRDVEVAYL